jgi:hypothetical protein
MPVKPHREVCMSLCEPLLYTDSPLYSPNLIIEDVVSSVVVEVGGFLMRIFDLHSSCADIFHTRPSRVLEALRGATIWNAKRLFCAAYNVCIRAYSSEGKQSSKAGEENSSHSVTCG